MEDNFSKELIYIQEHLASWKELSSQEIIFEKLAGGISREIYKVTAQRKEVEPNIIVFRRFRLGGPGDNHIEAFAFEALSSLEAGPKLYAANSEYRIEQYLDCRMIKAEEINQKQFRRKLVMNLASIHKINLKNDADKKGFFEHRLTEDFYKRFDHSCGLDTYDEEEAKFIKEIKYLSSPEEKEFIKGVINKEKQVFSHNDIWVGNILVIEGTSDPMLIDYEMMGYNYPGYDLGKLILETVFHRPKSPNPYWEVRKEYFPSEEDIIDFARYYLVASNCDSLNKQDKEELINDDQLIKQYEAKLFTSQEEYNNALENLLNQIRAGLMLSCYYCTVIGTALGKNTYPGFDFTQFAQDNYQFYGKFKEQFMNGIAEKK